MQELLAGQATRLIWATAPPQYERGNGKRSEVQRQRIAKTGHRKDK